MDPLDRGNLLNFAGVSILIQVSSLISTVVAATTSVVCDYLVLTAGVRIDVQINTRTYSCYCTLGEVAFISRPSSR